MCDETSTTRTHTAIRICIGRGASIVFPQRRCYRRRGTYLAFADGMATKSLAGRVAALEAKVGSKSIEEQFREQAELIDHRFTDEFCEQAQLIDRVFACRFEELDQRWSPRFATMERAIGAVQRDIGNLKGDVSTLKADVGTLKKDVNVLQKDMAIVRDGISVLLKRPPQ